MKHLNMHPINATKRALEELKILYPTTNTAILAMNSRGQFGGAATGTSFENGFVYMIQDSDEIRFYGMRNQTFIK